MQFRFLNEENKLIGYIKVDDYDTMFKTLTFMKEHNCSYCVEQLMKDDLADCETEGVYEIENVAFIIPNINNANEILPHFRVYLREAL